MKEYSNNYYLTGNIARITVDCEFWKYGYHITKIDYNGIRDTTVVFDNCGKNIKIYSSSNHTFNILNSGMINLGSVYDDTDTSKLFIVKTSFDFDTISLVYLLEDTLTKRGTGLLVDNEYNYVICGMADSTYNEITTTPNNTFTKAFLLKTTPNGTTIWSKSYIFAYDIDGGYWSGFKKILATYDGGFLLLGFMVNNHIDKNVVMKTDSLGNQQWVKFYGTSSYDNPTFTDIIPTHDSCYIVCGAYTYGETFGGLYPYDGWLIKIDNSGNTKWEKKYREHRIDPGDYRDSIYCQFYSVCEMSNNNIAIAGTARKETGYSNRTPFLYILNEYGDTLLTKYYYQYPDGHPDYVNVSYPTSIIATDDGGLAIGGWAEFIEYDEINQQWTNPQRIFLIKTDSLGNDTLISDISPVDAKPITEFKLVCYPNPASSEFFVELPQGIDDDVLEIYSANGSLVHEQRAQNGINTVNNCNLQPGVYLLRLRDKKIFGKIIIE